MNDPVPLGAAELTGHSEQDVAEPPGLYVPNTHSTQQLLSSLVPDAQAQSFTEAPAPTMTVEQGIWNKIGNFVGCTPIGVSLNSSSMSLKT